MDKRDIYVINGTDYKQMAYDLLEAADVDRMIGDKNRRVALKPNLILASPAERGTTTHPELCAGVIEYLRAKGFGNIVIMEGSWVGDRTSEAFTVCGYRNLSKKHNVPLIDTQHEGSHSVNCGGMELRVCDCVKPENFLINMPVMKGHCQTAVTCALKNMKGLIPNSEKRRFHTMGLMKPIAHLNKGIRQDFILVDAICGDLNFEEGGNPVVRNQVYGFADPVLCDAFACEQIGYELSDVPYIGIAERLGVGSADTASARIINLNEPKDGIRKQQSTRRVESLARKAEPKDACSACYGNLICALERLDEEGLLSRLKEKVCIGQGYQNMNGALGVGRCTKCFERSLPGCPPKATDIVRFLKEQIH